MMIKKRSLLIINQARQSDATTTRTAMYFSREFSRIMAIEDDMIHHLCGEFSVDDLTQSICDFIDDSSNLEDAQYLLYIYINLESITLIDSFLIALINRKINETFQLRDPGSHVTLVFMSDNQQINKILDFQLKNTKVSFNWVTIFNKNVDPIDEGDDTDTGVMIMNLILVFIKYARILSDIQLSELFWLLITEMHGSWVGETQIPVLTVSNDDLLSSYIF